MLRFRSGSVAMRSRMRGGSPLLTGDGGKTIALAIAEKAGGCLP